MTNVSDTIAHFIIHKILYSVEIPAILADVKNNAYIDIKFYINDRINILDNINE